MTIDVLEDGSHRPGGTALYAALQAARLGLRALILTRGVPEEIESLLEPWAGEFELRIQPADATTTLATRGLGDERSQRLLAWAGPIEDPGELRCAILHLAPVAAELPERWPQGGRLLGLTPQGLARSLPEAGGAVLASAPAASATDQAERVDAIVLSAQEGLRCARLIERAQASGALIALTDGERPASIIPPGGTPIVLPVHLLERPVDDLGAGDVYAAALFTALAEGRRPEQAGEMANAAAALRMQGLGPEAVAGRAEIEASLLGSR